MARFLKEIVKAGVYEVADERGNRREESLTPERLNHWAATHRQMKQAGLNIPGPSVHAITALPSSQRKTGVVMGNDGTVDSFNNFGFWDELWVEKDDQGVATLKGYIDVADEHANLVGTAVKETSIYARPQFMDGKGKRWNDALMHIALVTHPIEPGQKNFQRVNEGYTLAMSHRLRPLMMAAPNDANNTPGSNGPTDTTKPLNPDVAQQNTQTPASNASIQDAVEVLRQCGLDVGDDANPVNLIERIIIAGRQKLLSDGGAGVNDPNQNPLTQIPEGGKQQPASIAMSTQAQPIVAQLSPEAQAALTSVQSQNAILMSIIGQQYQSTVTQRIQTLVTKGLPQAVADAELLPLVPHMQMSVGKDGKPEANLLDRLLAVLEKVPFQVAGTAMNAGGVQNPFMPGVAMSAGLPNNAQMEQNPAAGANQQLSNDDAVKLADSILNATGFVRFAS